MESDNRNAALDLLATAGAAVVLLGMGLWNLMSVVRIPMMMEMMAELDAAELPAISRLAFRAGEIYVFHALSALLLMTGFGLLFATRDRLRGIVYALVISMLIAGVTVVIREATWLPLVKIIQSVNS